MTLKTLSKVIGEVRYEKYKGKKADGYDYYKVQEALRQSAIEDIKNLREESITDEHGDPLDEDRECTNDGGCGDAGFCIDPTPDIIEYIKKKFKITKKDLK